MNYARPQLGERLAVDYVLGLMPPRARRRFENAITRSATLAAAVARWSERLGALDAMTPDETPPAHVWRAIARRIGADAPVREPRVSALAFWRGFGALALAACVAVAIFVAADSTPMHKAVETLAERSGIAGWIDHAKHNPVDIGLSTMTLGVSERERPRWIRAALLSSGDALPIIKGLSPPAK